MRQYSAGKKIIYMYLHTCNLLHSMQGSTFSFSHLNSLIPVLCETGSNLLRVNSFL